MSIGDWFKEGWENYKSNVWTYVGLVVLSGVVLGLVVFGGFALAFWHTLKSAQTFGGMGAIATMGTALAWIAVIQLIALLIATYFQAAFLYTATERNVSIGDALSSAKDMFPSLLGAAIICQVFIGVPVIVGAIGDMALNTGGALTAIGAIISLFVAVKLISTFGRVALGEGAVESVKNAWKTKFFDSLMVLIGLLAAEFLVAIGFIVLALIPVIGWLVLIVAIPFVALPWVTATYVAAVKEIAG